MAKALFLLIFSTGYVLPLFARSWATLGISLLISVALVVSVTYWAGTGGGLVFFAFLFPILTFAAGAFAGHIASFALLLKHWPVFSFPGMIATVAGIAILPAAWEGYGYYRNLQSRKMYAELPNATTLPAIAACTRFRNAGPLLDAVLTRRPNDQRNGVLPATELLLRYPAPYLEPFPPRFPEKGTKAWTIDFEMYVDDAQPAPREDEQDENGRIVPVRERRASVLFRFSDDLPVARSAARTLNSLFGLPGSEVPPQFELDASVVPGLQAVRNPRPKKGDETESYVAMRNSEIIELVQCSGRSRVPNPQCTFRFDAAGVPISGRFRLANLTDWNDIRQKVSDFAECSVAATASRNSAMEQSQ
jgi:hypothetical protein